MSERGRQGEWTKGDLTSAALVSLAADDGLPHGMSVTAGMVELAQRHGLVGILSDHTEDRIVRAVLARESARQDVLRRHLLRILNQFERENVRVAVLKGPLIAESYRSRHHRPFTDLDLLVPEDQLDKALDILAGDGFAMRLPAKRPKADKRDVVFEDPSGMRFNVDLHWDLFSYTQFRGSADGATESAWSEAVHVPDSPLGPRWEISDAYRIAFLCTHAVLDHRFRLILFRDLLEVSRGSLDWDALRRVTDRWGLRSTTYLAWWIAKSALGARIPAGFLTDLRPRSLPLSYIERFLPRTDLVRFDGHKPHPLNLATVLLNDSPRGRLSLLLRAPWAFPHWQRRVMEEPGISESPRTLILASTDRRRGAEVFSERLRDGLLRRGWIVEAMSLRGYGEQPGADLEPLVDDASDSSRRFDLRIARELRAKIESFQPDVVVANGGATLRYAAFARLRRNFKLVYVGIGEPHYWLRSRLSRWLNRIMLRRVDEVLAVSEATREQLLELEPSLHGRISTTYTGVPDQLFDLPHSFRAGGLNVLMIGSLTPEKDPVRALRAVSALPEANLRFVGDGPLAAQLESEANHLDMVDRIELVGSVADVSAHLEWADVLILTSLSEGLPGAILEAGAAGVPTVAVDVGGVREAVIDGETGFVTEADDVKLIGALRALDSDRELLARMGKGARDHVRSLFALETVIERYAKALRRAAR